MSVNMDSVINTDMDPKVELKTRGFHCNTKYAKTKGKNPKNVEKSQKPEDPTKGRKSQVQ